MTSQTFAEHDLPKKPASIRNQLKLRPNTMASRIKALREDAEMTQADLGAAIGVSRTHLTNIEGGKGNPGRELLVAIATHFGVSLDWLSNGAGEPRVACVLDGTEALLIRAFRKLPPEEQKAHLNLIQKRLESRDGDA